jgi:hypothetical protein
MCVKFKLSINLLNLMLNITRDDLDILRNGDIVTRVSPDVVKKFITQELENQFMEEIQPEIYNEIS